MSIRTQIVNRTNRTLASASLETGSKNKTGDDITQMLCPQKKLWTEILIVEIWLLILATEAFEY